MMRAVFVLVLALLLLVWLGFSGPPRAVAPPPPSPTSTEAGEDSGPPPDADPGPAELELRPTARASSADERGTELRVRITDERGRPVSRAAVRVRALGVLPSREKMLEGEAAHGVFETRVHPDAEAVRVEVRWARDAAGDPLGATVAGPFAGPPAEVGVALGAGREVTGVVRGPAGADLSGVRVFAVPDLPIGAVLDKPEYAHALARPDTEGRVVLRGLGPYPYRVAFLVPTDLVTPRTVRLPAGERTFAVELRPAQNIVLRVVGPGGAAVEGAKIRFRPRSSAIEDHLETGPDGRVVLNRLDPEERYVLSIRRPPGEVTLVPEEIERPDWIPRDEVFAFRTMGVIRGRVVDADGAAVPRAELRAYIGPRPTGRSVDTDAEGRFRLEHLCAGQPVRLVAAPPEESPGNWRDSEVRVWPGKEEVVVRLSGRVGDLVVEVEGAAGARAELRAENAEAFVRHFARVGEGGRVVFPGLALRRTWTLWIESDGRYLYRTGLRAGDEVHAVLEPGLPVGGRIRFPKAATFPEARLSRGELSFFPKIGPDGSFRVDTVPPGVWRLDVRAVLPDGQVRRSLDVRAGDSVDVDLTDAPVEPR